MIVVDASVMVDFLLDTPGIGERISARIMPEWGGWSAPHLMDAEVAHAIRRRVLLGEVSVERAWAALELLMDLPVQRFGHSYMLRRVFALRDNATTYDALYLTLAEALGAPLLTRDRGLVAVPGVEASVELIH